MARIRVKLGSAEAEVEAEPDRLKEAIELVPVLAAKLPGKERESPEEGAQPATKDESASPARRRAPLPSVRVEKGDSLSDVIGKFFSDPWGRESRKLSDVREALRSYGLNYPKQSVAVALLRLAKTTKIRRFKGENGEFVYTAPSMAPLAPEEPHEETLDAVAEPSQAN